MNCQSLRVKPVRPRSHCPIWACCRIDRIGPKQFWKFSLAKNRWATMKSHKLQSSKFITRILVFFQEFNCILFARTQWNLWIDQHQKGRCHLNVAEFESDKLLQRSVYCVHKSWHRRSASQSNGEAKNSHRFKVSTLDTKRLVKTFQVVITAEVTHSFVLFFFVYAGKNLHLKIQK